MKRLTQGVVIFLRQQGFVVVTTIDASGIPHSSCKDIIKIDENGKIFLIDLYMGDTFKNLKKNPNINITAVDEHKFKGYCLKGKAKIVETKDFSSDIFDLWENKITSRMTQRVLKNIQGEKGHSRHPESQMPRPEYMIVMEVGKIVDLTPGSLK